MIDEKLFFHWMVNQKGLKENVAKTNVARIKRIDTVYDLLNAYINDECDYILSLFDYSKSDSEQGLPPSHDIVINGNYYTGTQSLEYALKLYIEYKNDDDYFENIFETTKTIEDEKAFTEVLASYREISHTSETEVPKNLNELKSKSTNETEEDIYMHSTSSSPVVFKGNLQAFLRYVGPFCKNYVNSMTKSTRKSHNGICEYCGKKAVLDSAHRDGEDRPIIIKKILESNFKKAEDYYEVDILLFEKMFRNAHFPVEDHIFFLCKDCHTEYDKGTKITTSDILAKRVM